jgi:perosamine synthetase
MTAAPGFGLLDELLTGMPRPTGTNYVTALEQGLADKFGVRHAVALSSGTAAIHVALRCLGVGPGAEVLVPALSVVMSVAPIIHAGARPVFVDCDRDGTDLDYDDATSKVTAATKAILPVHLWGRTGDTKRLAALAAEHGLAVVEDACQAQGTEVDGRYAGTSADAGCFSLKDGKILWSGEGGYLLTDREAIAGHARALRAHHQPTYGADPPADVGYNYRLAEPLAVIARENLTRFDAMLEHRRQQARQLAELLTGTPGISVLPGQPGWNGYSFLARIELDQPRAFCERLAQRAIPNSVGSFRLVAADQRRELARYARQPCLNAAATINRTLAVILTDHDDPSRLHRYAETIAEEARQWKP